MQVATFVWCLSLGCNTDCCVMSLLNFASAVNSNSNILALALPVLRTKPWVVADSLFSSVLNSYVKLITLDAPVVTLAHLKHIEDRMGRNANKRWWHRPIDVDLVWGSGQVNVRCLRAPHVYSMDRRFVVVFLFVLSERLLLRRLLCALDSD